MSNPTTPPQTSVHFLGIGGSGASAAAAIAKSQGFRISGCDQDSQSEFSRFFNPQEIFLGHSPKHLEGIDILATTPAVFSLDPHNPELKEAQKRGILVITWQEFLGKYLAKDKGVVAISGTHGKSTTTAMVGCLLEDAGLDPTVELGAVVPRWRANYRVGKGKYFVVEADEFNDNFLSVNPQISVVTTIEMDHPEYFQDLRSYQQSFQKFLRLTKEKIIANCSDPGVKNVLKLHLSGGTSVIDYSKYLIDFPLKIIGNYNIQNASAAYQVGLALGIAPEVIKKSLMGFSGINRRFEYLGDYQGAKVYSDFGHHPTEIKVTLTSAREKFQGQKILLLFQPHMFSRTRALFEDFVQVLKQAPVDKTYILDIYPSREVDTGLVSSQELVETINKPTVQFLKKDEVLKTLPNEIKNYDIIVFMGAGDIDRVALELLNSGQSHV